MQEKDCIRTIGRGLAAEWEKDHPDSIQQNPYSVGVVEDIVKEYNSNPEDTKRRYEKLFYYFDGLLGKIKSRGIHAGGLIVSPITLNDNYGTIEDTKGNVIICLDMDVCHEVQLVKYDLLVTKTTEVIKEAYDYAGIPYPKSHEIDWNDQKVWDDIRSMPYGIFQFEKEYATQLLRKFRAQSIPDMSLICAAIRPSGASYRDALSGRVQHHNPSPVIDDLLKDNLGYLVYQEDIIQFLQQICGLSGSEADTVRRGIAKKQPEILEKAMPRILEGYCSKSDKPREVAEQEAKEFLQIIEDSSSYMFGKNHSIAYCMISYICGWLRYYYPYEFITAFLDNAKNDEDIINGTILAGKRGITITMPKWGSSRAGYYFDKEQKIISKGLKSLKHVSEDIAESLYRLSQEKSYSSFMELLIDMKEKTSINSKQIDILIKTDFFDVFGNQKELTRIYDMYDAVFKKGTAKKVKRSLIDGTPLEEYINDYAVGITKAGKPSAFYTITDIKSLMLKADEMIKQTRIADFSVVEKAKNFNEAMGYPGYCSLKAEDRPKMFVKSCRPLRRRSDGKIFGYNIAARSIGSGKESSLTIPTSVFNKHPVKKNDVIYCPVGSYAKQGDYFRLNHYEILK